jgi:hypothetical protein
MVPGLFDLNAIAYFRGGVYIILLILVVFLYSSTVGKIYINMYVCIPPQARQVKLL